MIHIKDYEVWFVTGSQHLYGPEVLKQVEKNSSEIVEQFNSQGNLPCRMLFKSVVKTPEEITHICLEANNSSVCAGLVMWMHTFSPAKMWITGLNALKKPFAHLHTQHNRDIPFATIDMDFMNLNQAAHGDREFGFICSRMRKNRKVVVGHWQDRDTIEKLNVWMRVACAWQDMQGARICRFGDNMREVAVTEGDKVEAQIKFGYSVNGYGVGDLVACVRKVEDAQVDKLVKQYGDEYEIQNAADIKNSLNDAARIELGMRMFLEAGDFKGFTTTFEDLHGLEQLPGLAVQRLMADGYGFGGEGDWKTAALVRAMKVMAHGLKGGTSFMEDYTYHLDPNNMMVLGAHMLEVCPSIASTKPKLEVLPLGIGEKNDPARLVFDVACGKGFNATVVDMGNRFRMIVNEVVVESSPKALPKLPVARVLWKPMPDFKTAAQAWILGGGAHHTGFSMAITSEYMQDFAEMANIECLTINEKTSITDFKNHCRWNESYFSLAK
ncbi:MAG: L-arabinose isomerase [Planctomycetes bacterium GWF2_50_10]|nr:MAG: L-arabinose isomerase [Planctomycetes bacterium GWF2_50_10]